MCVCQHVCALMCMRAHACPACAHICVHACTHVPAHTYAPSCACMRPRMPVRSRAHVCVHMCVHVRVRTHVFMGVCVCMYVSVRACVYVFVHACVHVHVRTCMCSCAPACMHVHVHMHVCVRVCTCMCVHVFARVCHARDSAAPTCGSCHGRHSASELRVVAGADPSRPHHILTNGHHVRQSPLLEPQEPEWRADRTAPAPPANRTSSANL